MSEFIEQPEETLLERLETRLHPDDVTQYRKLHVYHFWEWKWHRICNESSLRGLRFLLYHSGLVSLDEQQDRDLARPFHQYAAELGFPIDMPERWNPFSGIIDPIGGPIREFLNPGNCLELYEAAAPRWIMHGYGDRLPYSLKTTLVNCLLEQLRGNRRGIEKVYHCPSFYSALKSLEIWSVADFVIGMRADPEAEGRGPNTPASLLLDSLSEDDDTLTWDRIVEVEAVTRQLLTEHQQEFQPFGAELVFGTMLGFLIDELAVRTAAPNGVGHDYGFASSALSVLKSNLPALTDTFLKTGAAPDIHEDVLGSDHCPVSLVLSL